MPNSTALVSVVEKADGVADGLQILNDGGGPVETTRFTALPAVTCVPATGFELITDPLGTVALDAVVTVPTANPAPVIAVVAAACVRLTTLGTADSGGPVDTQRFTALPV